MILIYFRTIRDHLSEFEITVCEFEIILCELRIILSDFGDQHHLKYGMWRFKDVEYAELDSEPKFWR